MPVLACSLDPRFVVQCLRQRKEIKKGDEQDHLSPYNRDCIQNNKQIYDIKRSKNPKKERIKIENQFDVIINSHHIQYPNNIMSKQFDIESVPEGLVLPGGLADVDSAWMTILLRDRGMLSATNEVVSMVCRTNGKLNK